MKINELLESRMAAMNAERGQLANAWAPIVEAARGYMKKQGKELTENMALNIARCAENALLNAGKSRVSKLFETTDTSNIDFLGIQLPIIAALIPSTVLNELAIVQALDRRSGGVFYLDVKYGQAKGSIEADSAMMAAKTGHNSTVAGRRYASTRVYQETVTMTTKAGCGANVKTGTLAYYPVITATLSVYVVGTATTATYTDDGTGELVADNLSGSEGHGHVTLSTGAIEITHTDAITSAVATYIYNYQTKTSSAVPEVNFDLTYETVTAEDFPLMAKYSLAAAFDLQKAHGLSLEDEVVKYLGGEVRVTMDHLGIDLMDIASTATGCATSPGTFDATIATGAEWIWKKYQFLDFVEKANVNILAKTLRMQCSWMIVGNNTARVIRQLAPNFKAAPGLDGVTPTGPYVLGTLDGRTVIHDPFIAVADIIFGWKGDSFIQGAFAFLPYIPLFTTPTLITATDLRAQKGFLSSAAYKVINPGAFCKGYISGLA